MITDQFIDMKNKRTDKVYLLLVDEDGRLCDGCDKVKVCASVSILGGGIMVICKDCLTEMIACFEDD